MKIHLLLSPKIKQRSKLILIRKNFWIKPNYKTNCNRIGEKSIIQNYQPETTHETIPYPPITILPIIIYTVREAAAKKNETSHDLIPNSDFSFPIKFTERTVLSKNHWKKTK